MKKWMIITLFALLTALLFCSAYAAEEHNWVWEQGETTHIRYCDGCTAYNHTDRVYDSTSHGHHAYICKWPKTEPQNQSGFIEIGLACNLCSKPQRAKAQMRSGTVPTCSRTGSHTYEYADSYATAKYDSEREHTYTVPTVDHQFDIYTPNNDATCTQNGTETAKCKYFYDGCTAMDTREIPNSALGHEPKQHPAKAPTCTEIGWNAYETCNRKDCDYTTYQEIPALDHDIVKHDAKTPTCTEVGWNAYETCNRKDCDYTTYQEIPALDHDIVKHDAKAPTCTEVGWNAYETCNRAGCDYTTYQEIPATGHSYKTKVVKPTCEKGGYTEHTCDACRDQYADQRTGKLLHWFGEWTYNGDGTHSAACKRKDCDHIGKTDCAALEVALGEDTIALCPVCGNTQDGKTFVLIEDAAAKAVTKRLPQGEPVLRALEQADGTQLLIVGFEYAGRLTQPTGEVEFTLPATLIEGKMLAILNADGTQTPLPCTIDGDIAAFTLDFTDSEISVQLIYIAPAAA